MTATYEGWTIRFGFLDGNLGSNDEATHAADYAATVQGLLEEAYPGAKVEVPWQRNTSGSLPSGLRILVCDSEGNEAQGEERNVNRIAEEAYSSGVWME